MQMYIIYICMSILQSKIRDRHVFCVVASRYFAYTSVSLVYHWCVTGISLASQWYITSLSILASEWYMVYKTEDE